jgi:hypothetical protein
MLSAFLHPLDGLANGSIGQAGHGERSREIGVGMASAIGGGNAADRREPPPRCQTPPPIRKAKKINDSMTPNVIERDKCRSSGMVVDHAQSLWITMVPGEAQSIIKAVCKIERAR